MSFLKFLKKLFSKPSKIAIAQNLTPVDEKPNSDGRGLLLYPGAGANLFMKTIGEYEGGYPKGAVIHFTAGRYEKGVQSAVDAINEGIKKGYAYLCIAATGEIIQAHPLNRWGYHAGESAWKGLLGKVSDDLVGIEMCNAGLVIKVGENRFKTWYGTYLTANEVRYVTEKEYGCPTGYYHKFSPEQERSLIDLLVWLKKNDNTGNFSVDLILGHHEVAGLKGIGRWRKTDPGGALSMPMNQLRKKVAELCQS